MTRPILIAVLIVDLVIVVVLFYSGIKDFLWAHPWWQSFLAVSPEIVLAVFAWIESRHSGEANDLRAEANTLRAEANRLRAELTAEQNRHLQQIADNTKKPVTLAERNADTLRKHLRANVTVTEEKGDWGTMTPEIVEVSENNIVSLFMPRGHSSSSAWCVRVRCDELEIAEIPYGSCPLRLKVLKRYGPDVPLGEINRWEDRNQPAATPTFAKGDVAYHATFGKPGSPEKRSLAVFTSKNGANSFLLEVSKGDNFIGNNVEISKRFMMVQVEY